ncbi:SMI1/KNR4 family protein [Xanthocytophaga agilis]|uniref:SMI1/KNR4 family protein n=1 Tax=Xanthocytophaga agilis TaxID=3048010 RepID=A0AAE3R3Q5_9BACT|nr:SMI1/KNR4 family protein [Xanthocytophaga agilis]MDJ1501019.1 SMI1/KNR4 family protein [Xanthocytophaga agilis]
MVSLVSILDQQLKNSRTEFYRKLNFPLTTKEIHEIEEQYGIVLPEDLKALYLWKNGQANDCYESFVNNSVFLSLQDALEIATEMTSQIGTEFDIENWWNKEWIPVFHNGGGDYICYDLGGTFTGRKGQLIEFWHADNDRNVIAPDMFSFIGMLNRYYQTHDPNTLDEYIELDNVPGYPENFMV